MSVSYDLRGSKTPADQQFKRQEFFRLLKLQQKLNDNYEKAVNEASRNQELGISPVAPTEKSRAEEAHDISLQYQIAQKNLESVMKKSEAQDALRRLAQQGQEALFAFNSNWKPIEKKLAGEINLSGDYIVEVFRRYMENKDSVGVGGEIRNADLYAELSRIVKNSMGVSPITGLPYTQKQFLDVITNQLGDLQAEYSVGKDQLLQAVQQIIRDNSAVQEINPATGRPYTQPEIGRILATTINSQSRVNTSNIIDALNRQVASTQGVNPSTGRTYTQMELVDLITEQIADISKQEAQAIVNAMEQSGGTRPSWLSQFARSPVETEPGATVPRAVSLTSEESPQPGLTRGSGMLVSNRRTRKTTHRKLVGRGIGLERPVHREFGNFLIDMPHLEKNILYVKHQSGNRVNRIPKARISDDVKALIQDILERKSVNRAYYEKLSPPDKRFLNKIFEKSKLDFELGLSKEITEQKREDFKRFELVRGIVQAGNNNPEVLEELAYWLATFQRDGLLDRDEVQAILVDLIAVKS